MIPFAVEFHDDAETELATIASHYDKLAAGLGVQFLNSVEASLRRIEQFPRMYPETLLSFRRAVVNRFPFGLAYQVADASVRIIAVYPLRSDPDDITHLLMARAN